METHLTKQIQSVFFLPRERELHFPKNLLLNIVIVFELLLSDSGPGDSSCSLEDVHGELVHSEAVCDNGRDHRGV